MDSKSYRASGTVRYSTVLQLAPGPRFCGSYSAVATDQLLKHVMRAASRKEPVGNLPELYSSITSK